MTTEVYRKDDFAVVVERSESDATVCWTGVSEHPSPRQFLTPLVNELSGNLKGLAITLDLRKVDFMNSATVSALIQWIKVFDTLSPRVRVLFRDVDWQRTQSSCLMAIARTLKNVQVEQLPVDP